MKDTIFALASAPGRSAVAIVRISGPRTYPALLDLMASVPAPRHAGLRTIRRSAGGAVIDHALVLWFPSPASFTGEDCGELHLHGGRAIVELVLRRLSAVPGLRVADPGEFTQRAFLNGRLDLTQAEGLADLIDSETELQQLQAMRQFQGGLGRHAEHWRENLLAASALVEAQIDFSEEEDVSHQAMEEILQRVAIVRDALGSALAQSSAAAKIREGVTIIVAGPPNAGKSSLMNCLAEREVAIVSPTAGTTRDAIEASVYFSQARVTLVDTAGLRDAVDPVEREGVARARKRLETADIILWLAEKGTEFTASPPLVGGQSLLRVVTKADLSGVLAEGADHAISVKDDKGLQALRDDLAARIRSDLPHEGEAMLTRERHRLACNRALEALERISAGTDPAVELIGEDLRIAVRALGSLVGRVDVEDILGDIFSRFCIGK